MLSVFRMSVLVSLCAAGLALTGCGSDSSLSQLEDLKRQALKLEGGARGKTSAHPSEREHEHGLEHESGFEHGAEHDTNDDRHTGEDDAGRADQNRIKSPGNQASIVGSEVSLQIEKVRAGDDDVYTFSAAGLPSGLAIDPVSGLISGSVGGQPGNQTVVVQAIKPSDDVGHVDRYVVTFSWAVTTN